MPNICPFCGRPATGQNRVCDSPICRDELRKSWAEGAIIVPDGFVTVTEYAKMKNISVQAVGKNCRQGKYSGAFQDKQSGRWYIPEETVKTVHIPRQAVDRKKEKRRPFKCTDEEWKSIVELAAKTKYSVNEYIIRKALEKLEKYET
jgi:hypothetical protein